MVVVPLTFSDAAQNRVGFALYQAQAGLEHCSVKPLKGVGSSVLEVVSRHDGDTYRAVYAVRFKAAVYVLHAFRKKAKKRIATPKQEIELIKRRLKSAEQRYKATYAKT